MKFRGATEVVWGACPVGGDSGWWQRIKGQEAGQEAGKSSLSSPSGIKDPSSSFRTWRCLNFFRFWTYMCIIISELDYRPRGTVLFFHFRNISHWYWARCSCVWPTLMVSPGENGAAYTSAPTLWSQATWVWILAPPLAGCVTLDRLLNFSLPHCL